MRPNQIKSCVLQMGKNWYTNESVWSLSFFYSVSQEDPKSKKKNEKQIRDLQVDDLDPNLSSVRGVERSLSKPQRGQGQ